MRQLTHSLAERLRADAMRRRERLDITTLFDAAAYRWIALRSRG